MNFFLNGEFLCFTTLTNFVKKFLCQTLRRRANLEKTDLICQTTHQFCIFDSFNMCFDTQKDGDKSFQVVCLTVKSVSIEYVTG